MSLNNSKIRVVDLFAGVGGFHLGLTRASTQYEVIWANQYEPSRTNQFAYNIYKNNFPQTPISNDDINKIDKNNIPDMDLLVAGFPCQDYSIDTSKAKGIVGKKGVLWWQIYEVLYNKKPSYVLFENVDRLLASPGVRSEQPGRDFGIILRTLSDLGYNVSWKMINAADYGYPQRRKRAFIFGYKKNTIFNKYVSKIIKEDDEIEEFLKVMPPFSSTMLNEKIADIEHIDLNNYKTIDEFSKIFFTKKDLKI